MSLAHRDICFCFTRLVQILYFYTAIDDIEDYRVLLPAMKSFDHKGKFVQQVVTKSKNYPKILQPVSVSSKEEVVINIQELVTALKVEWSVAIWEGGKPTTDILLLQTGDTALHVLIKKETYSGLDKPRTDLVMANSKTLEQTIITDDTR